MAVPAERRQRALLHFVNASLMPDVPPAFTKLARSRGTDEEGAVPKDTTIMFAIGGEAGSSHPGTWDWLTSKAKAEAMAEHVAQWPSKYGCDGSISISRFPQENTTRRARCWCTLWPS